MGYLVSGDSVTSYYGVMYGGDKPRPFTLFFGDAETADQAIGMARDYIEANRRQVALVRSITEASSLPGAYDPYKLDYEKPWWTNKLAAFDVETTGLDPKKDRITEIGFSEYNPETRRFDKVWSYFVNEGVKISKKVTELTGITNEMIADAPPFSEVIEQILDDGHLSCDMIYFAHNYGFDKGFLLESLFRDNIELVVPHMVCTMELGLRTDLNQPNNRLGTLGEILEIEGVNSHRAGEDAQLCGNVGLALLRRHKYFHTATTRQFLDYFDKYSWPE